jgi:hypothetical protein
MYEGRPKEHDKQKLAKKNEPLSNSTAAVRLSNEREELNMSTAGLSKPRLERMHQFLTPVRLLSRRKIIM